VDKYWTPPDFYPSAQTPRPDATTAAAASTGFSVTASLAATTTRFGQSRLDDSQPLLHRVPRQDDQVFVRLAEDDLRRREQNLAALTRVCVCVCV
jgi:hypothetical protein